MEIISKEIIKPISPTPNHLKSYEYSIFDQFSPSCYISVILCYPPPPPLSKQNNDLINSSRTKQLKKTLSKVLAHYYFLAGRLTTDNFVDCNDEGVPFVEALVHNKNLEDILNNPQDEFKLKKSLVPITTETFTSTLLLSIQVSLFECGGMVLGISATHKVLDASSLITFLTDWSFLACYDDPNFVLTPLIPTISKMLPPITNDFSTSSSATDIHVVSKETYVTNVYVFSPCSIADLKMKVATKNIPKPSRVEVVTSVLWKLLTANSKEKSWLAHVVNMRKRVEPPLNAHCIGNFIGFSVASKEENEKDATDMVIALRKGLLEFDNQYIKKLQGDEAIGTFFEMLNVSISLFKRKNEEDIYIFTSWCGFSFYDVDFGWGKPIMFSSIEEKNKDIILLIDTKDGGVEACITLSEDDMKMFDKNSKELLMTYATLKASISHNEN